MHIYLDCSKLVEGLNFECAWDYLFTRLQIWQKLPQVGVEALG